MGLSNKQITSWPNILNTREKILKQRHSVLSQLHKAIYNEEEPEFVSLKSIATGTDEKFCQDVAKISLQQYYDYLKTL